ncbi:mobile mystery protein B [Oscillatoria amoena NRMC-F 0135]|nr:mobile mystery protein B [Oscillatoria amoena NRMC-F 0135]
MGLDFDWADGQTPLDEEEKEGLLIPTITTRGELDEFEQRNIEKAIQWSLMRRVSKEEILTEKFVKLVHEKMYDGVWAWAGEFRKANKNIGVDWRQVSAMPHVLLGDCRYWIDHDSYPPDEIAVLFKHRLVSIHCFSNGNGRHSRMMGDLLVEKIFNQPVFTWGAQIDLIKSGDTGRKIMKIIQLNKIPLRLAFFE